MKFYAGGGEFGVMLNKLVALKVMSKDMLKLLDSLPKGSLNEEWKKVRDILNKMVTK